ncbi:hypothetical protein Bca52824_072785 [Brassica carinata]|uniref:Uncharacterized protein n=1 Tax=Brassica carinata TaxID=52824 RepID=A0A8X7Q8L9_BRACI|nr:hypothetical protein Bca52824_072785 [Brassica carinata]
MLEALSSPRLASPIPPVFQDSSRFHGVEQWTKGKRSKRSRFDFNHHNLTEEEDLAFCLMLLARDGNRQLLPLPPVTVVAEKSLSYKCSVCDKSFLLTKPSADTKPATVKRVTDSFRRRR